MVSDISLFKHLGAASAPSVKRFCKSLWSELKIRFTIRCGCPAG